MTDELYFPDSSEAEVDQRSGEPVLLEGQRGKLGYVTLTNDRILFSQQKFAASGGSGALAAAVAAGLQKRSEKKSGGPIEVLALDEVRGVSRVRRKLLPDLYEFALADGSAPRIGWKLAKSWDPKIRRLLTERHGRTLVEEGEESWRVE